MGRFGKIGSVKVNLGAVWEPLCVALTPLPLSGERSTLSGHVWED